MQTLHNLHDIDTLVGALAVTVRLGNKWAGVTKGERIELCRCYQDVRSGETTHTVVGEGIVQQWWVGDFYDLPARYIELEHETSSRLFTGLLASMRRAYQGFKGTELVTTLMYQRVK